MKVVAIIPALNEEAAIGGVVHELRSSVLDEIIVVDNGSTDRTAEVALAAGARVVHQPERGYGAACHRRPGGSVTHGESARARWCPSS